MKSKIKQAEITVMLSTRNLMNLRSRLLRSSCLYHIMIVAEAIQKSGYSGK